MESVELFSQLATPKPGKRRAELICARQKGACGVGLTRKTARQDAARWQRTGHMPQATGSLRTQTPDFGRKSDDLRTQNAASFCRHKLLSISDLRSNVKIFGRFGRKFPEHFIGEGVVGAGDASASSAHGRRIGEQGTTDRCPSLCRPVQFRVQYQKHPDAGAGHRYQATGVRGSHRQGRLWTQIGSSLDANFLGFASRNKSLHHKHLAASNTSLGRFGRKFPEHFFGEGAAPCRRDQESRGKENRRCFNPSNSIEAGRAQHRAIDSRAVESNRPTPAARLGFLQSEAWSLPNRSSRPAACRRAATHRARRAPRW